MKYTVNFSCGHEEVRDLVGPTKERMRKIKYWEERGVCSSCWREMQDEENAVGCNEVEMLYRDYKQNYSVCKTKSGSYDGEKKTIIVYVPKEDKK